MTGDVFLYFGVSSKRFNISKSTSNTFHFVMHISIIKGIKLGFATWQTHKDQREIKECLHIQNSQQITIINLFKNLQLLQLMPLWVCKFVDPCLIPFIMEMYITKWKVLSPNCSK